MIIKCPHCKQKYNIDQTKVVSLDKIVKCKNCGNQFQVVYKIPEPNESTKDQSQAGGKISDQKPCPFCGNLVPKTAIRCKFCGKFKKKAKLTIKRIRDEQARNDIIAAFNSKYSSFSFDLKNMLENLPRTFQVDYSAAIELDIMLRNKGVEIEIEEGDEIIEQKGAPAQHRKDSKPAYQETIYPKITFEQVLKDIYINSSIKKEFISKYFTERKDLLVIFFIAFIPFLSIGMNVKYQILFFPTFLGILWAFIILAFLGDGNIPIKKAVLFFLFAATISPILAILGEIILGQIFNSFPPLFNFIIVVGFTEELVKIIPVLYLIKKPKKDRVSLRHIDIFVLSLICGIGFSTSENIIYKIRIDNLAGLTFLFDPDNLPGISNMNFFRMISLPLLHGSFTVIFGTICFYGFTIGKMKKFVYIGLAISAIIHGVYDHLESNFGNSIVALTCFISVLFFHSFSSYTDKMKSREINQYTN